MATFFVGQRVRVVESSAHPEFIGKETRITGVAYGEYAEQGYEWLVWLGGETFGACSYNLTPILPDGHQPCDTEFKRDLDRLLEGVAA